MRGLFLCAAAGWLLAGSPASATGHTKSREADLLSAGPIFTVGGLKFTLPAKCVSLPVENPMRAGQWRIPPAHGQTGESGEVVVFYFGPGSGGTVRQNLDAWKATMLDVDGHPAAAEEMHHETAGFKISEVVLFGAHREVVPIPGIPPLLKPASGLMGAVIEGPSGNIYWRFTGPEPWLIGNLPLFNKIIDSVQSAGK